MIDLFDIVANRPLSENRADPPTCPFCKSKNVHARGTESTLVGYIGVDRNHKWTQCTCVNCDKEFVRESKGPDIVWYTQDDVVLRGVPRCFERYVYQCAKCGGAVERNYTDLNGAATTCLTTKADEDGSLTVRMYKTFYRCTECGHGGQTKDDYYKGGSR